MNNIETLHIALNLDDAYLQHASVMLTSLFENNKDLPIEVHAISEALATEVRQQLETLVRGKYGREIHFYMLSGQRVADFPQYVGSHISQAANYRLFMAELLPERVQRVVYLDCDLVVESSLRPLLQLDLAGNAVAAAEDMWSGKAEVYDRLGYGMADGYFNSGVLVADLDVWRRDNLSARFIDYVHTHHNLKFFDQDILNGVLHGCWLALDPRWNVQDGYLRRHCRVRPEMLSVVRSQAEQPAIVHYTGHRKPWNYDSINPYTNRYFHYLDLTAWRGWRPEVPSAYRRKVVIDRLLYALRLKPAKYDARYRAF